MHQLVLVTGVVLGVVCCSLTAQAGPNVHGEIEILDEKDQRWNRFRLNAFVELAFHRLSPEGEIGAPCPGRGRVGSESWDFRYIIPPECHGQDLEVRTHIRPAPDWVVIPPPARVAWVDGVEDYEIEAIRIRRPRNPAAAVRAQLFEQARTLISKNLDHATFLLNEASRGNDYEYTAASANLLESQDRIDLVYPLLANKRIEKLAVSRKTKFKFAMRKGNAARSSDLALQALQSYAEAQNFLPDSKQPMQFGYTVAKQRLKVKSSSAIARALSENPALMAAFAELYDAWNVPNKPPASGKSRIGEEELRFTAAMAF